MKRLIVILSIIVARAAQGQQNLEVIKISQFPLLSVGQVQSNQLFVLATPGLNNRALQAFALLDAMWSFSSNASNINLLLQNITNTYVSQTNSVSLRDGFMLPVAGTSVNTNQYWWDFGRLSTSGQHIVYGSIDGTNSVQFLGVTNGLMWQPFSFNVVARGGNITMFMPTNLPHFDTNKWTLSGTSYVMILTNGNEFGMSVQSNNPSNPTLSTIWRLSGQ